MAAFEFERADSAAPAPQSDSAPVDLAHLRRYTMGDRSLELEILGLFVDQLPITIGALKSAAGQKQWAMAAHTLKGSARAVGAWSLGTIAERAERLGPLPSEPERGHIIEQLEEAASAARAYIATLAEAA